MRVWTVLCALALLTGCTSKDQAPKTAWSEDGRPLTIVEFVDDTSWPFEIEEVRIALDGETIVDHAAPVGASNKWAFEAPFESLPHGDHTLSVWVRARYASTRLDASEGCAVEWRSSRTFGVGARPVGVRIVAETDDVVSRFVDRLDVAVTVAGEVPSDICYLGAPERKLIASNAACRDDGPLPFGDDELARGQRFGPELLR